MKTLSRIMLALCMLFAFVSAASAQVTAQSAQDFMNRTQASPYLGTPDGVPPSGETICQGQTGAAHGLCTAYCEAMDCDSADPQASPKACAKVAGNYAKITGQSTLPCDCPCVAQYPGFIDAVNGPIQSCFAGPSSFFNELVVLFPPDPNGFQPASTFATGFGLCGNFNGAPIPITEQQGVACNNLLKQRAAAAGVTCSSGPAS